MFETVLIIAEQVFLYLPLILGAYISFSLMKIPNLSLEASFITGAVFAAKLLPLTHATNLSMTTTLLLTILASMMGGVTVGIIVTMLDVHLKIPHLLASILTISLCYGLNLFILGSSNFSLTRFSNPLALLPISLHPELIILAFIGVVLLALVYLFLKTQLGFCIAVYGNNPIIFGLYRISTAYIVSCGLIISTMLAGISGFFVAQSSGFVDINAGPGMSMFCVTTLVLGKMLFSQRYALSFIIPLAGLTTYCMLQQMLLKVGFSAKYFMVLQTVIVITVLVIKYHSKSVSEHGGDHLGV